MRRYSIVAAIALAACSGGGAASATTPLTAAIGLSLSLTNGRAARGGSTSTAATLSRVGGFSGAVTMSATDVPPGVQVSFDPATLSGATAVTTVTFAVSETATRGFAPINVRASATGVADAYFTYTLQIQ